MNDNFKPIVRSNIINMPPGKPSDNKDCEMKHIKDLWKEIKESEFCGGFHNCKRSEKTYNKDDEKCKECERDADEAMNDKRNFEE